MEFASAPRILGLAHSRPGSQGTRLRDGTKSVIRNYLSNDQKPGELDAAAFGRATTVMRQRCDVADLRDLKASRLERAHGRLPSGSRAFKVHGDLLEAVELLGLLGGVFGGHACGVGRRFTRTFEPTRSRA